MDVVNENNAEAVICLTNIRIGDEVTEHFKCAEANHELIEVPLMHFSAKTRVLRLNQRAIA